VVNAIHLAAAAMDLKRPKRGLFQKTPDLFQHLRK
jgi:hypothetical protein